jgi:transposase
LQPFHFFFETFAVQLRLICMSTAAHHSESVEPVGPGHVPLPTPEQLPDDPVTLKQMIVELVVTLRQRDHDLEETRQRLHLLLQRLYGRRSERFDPDQLLLFADYNDTASASSAGQSAAPEQPADEPETQSAKRRRRKGHGRRRLPEDLPRRPLHHELSEAERICVCGQTRIDIGTDSGGEQLDWQPASYFVWQHWIHKYLCPNCAGKGRQTSMATAEEPTLATPQPDQAAATPAATGTAASVAPAAQSPQLTPPSPAAIGPAIISARKPAMPIDKGLPGPGLLAHIIVSKYFDHLPLYRQENISGRQGVLIPRSTSCGWMAASAELLRPLYDRMVASILQSLWLHTDDTPVKNMGHEPGTTDKARFWIYYGDRAHPYNVFDFTINRKRDGPQTFLADFHGYLHADAFSGYDALYLPNPRADSEPIKEVACNAHARRKFHEAKFSDELRAHEALAYYRQLYELERAATANNFDDDQRRRMRQDLSVLILDKFKAWLDQQRDQVLPKSPMAEAIGYALNNWTALIRYTEAGFLSIDNNVAEREMKRIAIGRKNWLFVGSANGGRTAAVLFSFTSTCHRLGIEPWAYLQDVLTRLPRTPAHQLAELLADRWEAARKQAEPLRPESAAPSAPDSLP